MPSTYEVSEDKIWYDPKTQLLFFYGEIQISSASKLLRIICRLEADPEIKEYSFVITSGGGDLVTAINMYDILKSSKKLKATFAWDMLASAAIYPFLSSNNRYCSIHTQFVLHPGSWKGGETEYTAPSLKTQYCFNAKLDEIAFSLLTNLTNVNQSLIDELAKTGEWYLNAHEAQGYCIVTEIRNAPTFQT